MMFEGSDLSMAYGGLDPMPPMQQAPTYNPQPPAPTQFPPPPAVQQNTSKPPVMVSVQQPGDLPYQPPEAMYQQQKPMYHEETFLDRLTSKKFEVLKMAVFSFIILFAISMDKFFTHYLTQYIGQSILTTTQEVLVRGAYPISILLVIWFVKAL